MSFNSALNSTLDSTDGLPSSPVSSQTGSVFVTKTSVRNQHLTLSQMRGVKQVWHYYFPKNTGKRMNKDEKNRRWNSYKNKIYQEYSRIITGKFQSEKALIKRYSEVCIINVRNYN